MTKANETVTKADLTALLDDLKYEVMAELNAVAIARIESFDPVTMTAKASLQRKKLIDGVAKDHPPLLHCPVVVAGGGGCRLTFPIQSGDLCLALFNDRDMDGWYQAGAVVPPNTARLHSFSDAILVVGLYSQREASSAASAYGAYDATRARLANGKVAVAAGPAKVLITEGVNTLGSILTNLVDQISAVATEVGGPSGIVPNSMTTQIANLVILRAELAELLE